MVGSPAVCNCVKNELMYVMPAWKITNMTSLHALHAVNTVNLILLFGWSNNMYVAVYCVVFWILFSYKTHQTSIKNKGDVLRRNVIPRDRTRVPTHWSIMTLKYNAVVNIIFSFRLHCELRSWSNGICGQWHIAPNGPQMAAYRVRASNSKR